MEYAERPTYTHGFQASGSRERMLVGYEPESSRPCSGRRLGLEQLDVPRPGLGDTGGWTRSGRFMVLGWTSEIQLHLPVLMGNEAMIGFANAWAPVHSCYAAFGTLQAWFATRSRAKSCL